MVLFQMLYALCLRKEIKPAISQQVFNEEPALNMLGLSD